MAVQSGSMADRAFVPVRIAVLTVSDTRGPQDDRSGDTLVERLTAAGHILAGRTLVRDDRPAIEERCGRGSPIRASTW